MYQVQMKVNRKDNTVQVYDVNGIEAAWLVFRKARELWEVLNGDGWVELIDMSTGEIIADVGLEEEEEEEETDPFDIGMEIAKFFWKMGV